MGLCTVFLIFTVLKPNSKLELGPTNHRVFISAYYHDNQSNMLLLPYRNPILLHL